MFHWADASQEFFEACFDYLACMYPRDCGEYPCEDEQSMYLMGGEL